MNRDACPCCTDGIGWIWNADTQAVENCPACNPARSEQAIENSLNRALDVAEETGNRWLGQLAARKSHQNHASRIERAAQPAVRQVA